MANQNHLNAIKRHITGGGSSSIPSALHVGERDGQMWASNRYWLTPAVRVAPLLEKYNLDPAAPGSYLVNGDVRPDGEIGIDSGKLERMLEASDYTTAVHPVLVAGHQAYVDVSGRDRYLAVYQDQAAGGTVIGLAADTLAWLSYLGDLPTAHREWYGPVRYAMHQTGQGNCSVLISADLMRTVEPARYSDERDEKGRQAYIEAVTENLGSRVIGAMMAMKLGG